MKSKHLLFFPFFLFFILSLTVLVSATSAITGNFVYDNPTIPHLNPSFNQSSITVNNSIFWQGYTPTTLPHNILSGLQGGQSGQYYHLNQSLFDRLVSYAYLWITGDNVAYVNASNNWTQPQIFLSNVTFNNSVVINGNLNVTGTITGTLNVTVSTANFSYYSGQANNSDFLNGYNSTTLPHNGLAGLQGGNATLNEFYHLDVSQYAAVVNQSTNFVPFEGATKNVNLTNVNLTAANLFVPIGGQVSWDANKTGNNITNGSLAYMFYNSTSKRLEMWVNGRIQQDWGNSTTIYGTATFEADAFFQNLSGVGLLINTNVIVNGNVTSYEQGSFANVFAGNICYSDGTNCTYINSSIGNLTQAIFNMNSSLYNYTYLVNASLWNYTFNVNQTLYQQIINLNVSQYNDTALILNVNSSLYNYTFNVNQSLTNQVNNLTSSLNITNYTLNQVNSSLYNLIINVNGSLYNYTFNVNSSLYNITQDINNSLVNYYKKTENVTPPTNMTYSLGNSTNWWTNLWVATINAINIFVDTINARITNTVLLNATNATVSQHLAVGLNSTNATAEIKGSTTNLNITVCNNTVACYRFEEGSGTIALDSSRYLNLGFIKSDTHAASKGSNGTGNYSIQSNAGYVVAGAASQTNLTDNFTLSAWVNITVNSNNNYIISKNNDKTLLNGYILSVQGDKKLYFTVVRNGVVVSGLRATDNIILGAGTGWHHVAATINGTNVALYIDGVARTTQGGALALAGASTDLFIGSDSTTTKNFNGWIDEVGVYNSILNSSDITNLFNNGFTFVNDTFLGFSTSPFMITKTSAGDIIIVDQQGRVGINNPNPTATLDVNGTIQAISAHIVNDLFVGGTIVGGSPVKISGGMIVFGGDVNGSDVNAYFANLYDKNTTDATFLNATTANNTYVPFEGATQDLNLTNVNLTVEQLIIPLGGDLHFGNGTHEPNATNFMRYNITSQRLELWANGKIQQDWGNSTTIYGKATFEADAFFKNMSGEGLFVNTNMIVDGNVTSFGNSYAVNMFAGNICYSDGSNCTYINSSIGNLTNILSNMNTTMYLINSSLFNFTYNVNQSLTNLINNETNNRIQNDSYLQGQINNITTNFFDKSSNVTPIINMTYALGNSTNWWNTIWVGSINSISMIIGTINAATINTNNLNATNITAGIINASQIVGYNTTNELRNVFYNVSNPSAYLNVTTLNASIIMPLYSSVQQDPFGFDNTNGANTGINANITWNETSRILSITGVYSYWYNGTQYFKNGTDSVTVPVTSSGIYFIYYVGPTLTATVITAQQFILQDAAVAAIYWNGYTNKTLWVGDEKHGHIMPGQVHLYLHQFLGTRYVSGLDVQNISVVGTGNSPGDAELYFSPGTIADEDYQHIINSFTYPQQIDVFYQIGSTGNWSRKVGDNYPMIYSGDSTGYIGANSRIAYNLLTGNTWSLTQVPANNNYVLIHFFATDDVNNSKSIFAVEGQAVYTSIANAQAGATTEINSIITTGLPMAESKALATVVVQTAAGFTNVPHARFQPATAGGAAFIDWRQSQQSGTSGNIGGTVTLVATGTGLTGGPITGSGTISIDPVYIQEFNDTALIVNVNGSLYNYTFLTNSSLYNYTFIVNSSLYNFTFITNSSLYNYSTLINSSLYNYITNVNQSLTNQINNITANLSTNFYDKLHNVTPTQNLTYSLGNSSNWWYELWVSTINSASIIVGTINAASGTITNLNTTYFNSTNANIGNINAGNISANNITGGFYGNFSGNVYGNFSGNVSWGSLNGIPYLLNATQGPYLYDINQTVYFNETKLNATIKVSVDYLNQSINLTNLRIDSINQSLNITNYTLYQVNSSLYNLIIGVNGSLYNYTYDVNSSLYTFTYNVNQSLWNNFANYYNKSQVYNKSEIDNMNNNMNSSLYNYTTLVNGSLYNYTYNVNQSLYNQIGALNVSQYNDTILILDVNGSLYNYTYNVNSSLYNQILALNVSQYNDTTLIYTVNGSLYNYTFNVNQTLYNQIIGLNVSQYNDTTLIYEVNGSLYNYTFNVNQTLYNYIQSLNVSQYNDTLLILNVNQSLWNNFANYYNKSEVYNKTESDARYVLNGTYTPTNMVNKTTGTFFIGQLLDYIIDTMQSSIDSLWTTKLNVTDQRYNDTVLILTVNGSLYNYTFNVNDTLYQQIINLNVSQYNDTVLILDVNGSLYNYTYNVNSSLYNQIVALNVSQYNDTVLILSVNGSLYNYTFDVNQSLYNMFGNYYTKSQVYNKSESDAKYVLNGSQIPTNLVNKTTGTFFLNQLLDAIIDSLQSSVDSLWTTKLNATDQRYNDTSLIYEVNGSLYNYTYNVNSSLSGRIDAINQTLDLTPVYGNITDLYNTKLNITDQRYNDTILILDVNGSLYNYTYNVNSSLYNQILALNVSQYNDTTLIYEVNGTLYNYTFNVNQSLYNQIIGLNVSQYNDTSLIYQVNGTLYNYTFNVNETLYNFIIGLNVSQYNDTLLILNVNQSLWNNFNNYYNKSEVYNKSYIDNLNSSVYNYTTLVNGSLYNYTYEVNQSLNGRIDSVNNSLDNYYDKNHNVTPITNMTYSLGNQTNWWYSLWVGTINTINIFVDTINARFINTGSLNATNITAGNIVAGNLSGTLSWVNISGVPYYLNATNGSYLYSINGTVYFNETLNNQTIADIANINAFQQTVIVNVTGGTGFNVSTPINYYLTQLIVTAPTNTTTFNFQATQTNATGSMIDKDRMQHTGTWNIEKDYSLTNDTVYLKITNASQDGAYTILIKYINAKYPYL